MKHKDYLNWENEFSNNYDNTVDTTRKLKNHAEEATFNFLNKMKRIVDKTDKELDDLLNKDLEEVKVNPKVYKIILIGVTFSVIPLEWEDKVIITYYYSKAGVLGKSEVITIEELKERHGIDF